MSGEYYVHGSFPSPGSVASSSAVRSELNAIQSGFDKLPALSGNGNKIVAVNSGGTALEALTTTGTGSGVRATSPTLTTPTINTSASVGGTWTAASAWTLPAFAASAGITMSGTASNLGLGANYISYGGTDAGLSFDSSNNATLSGTLKVGNGGSSFLIGLQDDSNYLRIHGSNAVNQGAGINLFGGSHATLPNIGKLISGSTTVLEWGSAGNITLGGATATASPYAAYRSIEGMAGQFYLSTASTEIGLLSNAYRNSSGNYIYRSTAAAAYFYQSAGVTAIGGADSGTAGDQITTFTALFQVEKGKSVALQGATPQAGTGISFPASQSASTNANTLDDYEEGTWTPTFVSSGASFTYTANNCEGKYTKVGNKVFCTGSIQITAKSGGTAANTLSLGGLPFTPSQVTSGGTGMSVNLTHITAGITLPANYTFGDAVPSGTTIAPYYNATNGSGTSRQWQYQDISATTTIQFAFSFTV